MGAKPCSIGKSELSGDMKMARGSFFSTLTLGLFARSSQPIVPQSAPESIPFPPPQTSVSRRQEDGAPLRLSGKSLKLANHLAECDALLASLGTSRVGEGTRRLVDNAKNENMGDVKARLNWAYRALRELQAEAAR